MPNYQKADDDTHNLVRRVMERYHHELAAEGVTVDVLWAFSEGDHPLKLRGYPAAATVEVTSLKNRALGVADSVIRIDQKHWRDINGAARTALIDHELTHLQLVRNDEDDPTRDDLGRPRLKSIPHDWEIGGFDIVVERHKQYAPEKIELEKANTRLSQGRFFSGDEGLDIDEDDDTAAA